MNQVEYLLLIHTFMFIGWNIFLCELLMHQCSKYNIRSNIVNSYPQVREYYDVCSHSQEMSYVGKYDRQTIIVLVPAYVNQRHAI